MVPRHAYNINNSIQHQCFFLHTVKWLNSSIGFIGGTEIGTTTPDPSESGSNGYEGVLHIP